MKKSKVKPGAAIAPPGEGEFSLIPHSKLLDLYAAMLKCRMIAKGIPLSKKARGKRSLLTSEAVTVGVTIDLLATDAISPAPTDLMPCAVKMVSPRGVAIKSLLRWWSNPAARIPSAIARANVIAPAASTEARLEAALRLAAHFRSTNSGSVVLFFAALDTPPSKPAAPLESLLRQAAARRLPILFVRQSEANNDPFTAVARDCDIPGMVVDQDDVVAVYRVAYEALAHARRGNGPTLVDCKPWRVKGGGRKTRGSSDSIGKMELYLEGKGLAYKSIKNIIKKKFAGRLERA